MPECTDFYLSQIYHDNYDANSTQVFEIFRVFFEKNRKTSIQFIA